MWSELGEPIHKIVTRAVKSLTRRRSNSQEINVKRGSALVLTRSSRDFAKPWFAQKKDGTVVKDLGDLTYEETALRLVRLMYVKHQSRWIDISLHNLLGDWLCRVEERFAGINGKPKQLISSPTTRSMTLNRSSLRSLRGTPRCASNCLPRKI